MLRCPICKSEIKTTSNTNLKCVRCGFDDIRTEFINDEERIFWQTYVVTPCKYAYNLSNMLSCGLSKLKEEVDVLNSAITIILEENKKKQWNIRDIRDIRRDVSQLTSKVDLLDKNIGKISLSNVEPKSNYGSAAPIQPKTMMLNGWNYDDPIAHPNSATGSSLSNITFSVSDIKSQMTSSSTATITFLVKKESDKKGKSSTDTFWVRYRVKDKSGVILLNETHYVNGLQVGDVTRGTIKLTGVTAGEHTIDFVSYS